MAYSSMPRAKFTNASVSSGIVSATYLATRIIHAHFQDPVTVRIFVSFKPSGVSSNEWVSFI